ncbi:SpoIIE family protein phosphatase [Methylomonas sp. LL1]|uniref:SpoIIE family protein phosphatase n=1 Tax=Methylomonas sp. LL1 TaxID=2785785 RepID=UPI0018C3A1C8|nr:SpoIIE family protein phosphatase [Methylomonas sp. LL1]QPK65290.1 SpoIIE family protein phosphatase [Methylomonas sp. LL1]
MTATDKILCVDDEANILHMFQRTLGRKHQLLTAGSALAGLDLLREHSDIAIIISDYNMPDIDGVEFLKQAHALSPDSVQIMLTGNIDLGVSIRAINETHIFRYLPKPCPSDVLHKVVLDALDQHHLLLDKRRLSLELAQKNQELADQNARLSKKKYLLEYELEMAKAVYCNVASCENSRMTGLDYRVHAKDAVGGDFLLTHISPDRRAFYLIMGDLTGHGLESALAVLLVAESFDLLCGEQPSIEHLAQAINDKMCGKLPTGLFCAAFLIKLDLIQQCLHIWQGGMPDGYFLDAQGGIVKTLHSNNLALGVLAGQDYSGTASRHAITDAQSLFFYSDGVIEQLGVDQTLFGDDRLKQALLDTPTDCRRIDFVMTALDRHRQQNAQTDDISLLELKLPDICKTLERA